MFSALSYSSSHDGGYIAKPIKAHKTADANPPAGTRKAAGAGSNIQFHDHLQVIRSRQKAYYHRNCQKLVPTGGRTCNDVRHSPESPAILLKPAEMVRSMIVKTKDGREMPRS
ncbi:hypothetical protein MTO96_010339 [Rhipicephalus appendiculatus]